MIEKMNLISAKDAAHRLNISRGMLSRLVKSGRLGVYRIGDRTLFDEKILEEFKAAVFEPQCKRTSGLKQQKAKPKTSP